MPFRKRYPVLVAVICLFVSGFYYFSGKPSTTTTTPRQPVSIESVQVAADPAHAKPLGADDFLIVAPSQKPELAIAWAFVKSKTVEWHLQPHHTLKATSRTTPLGTEVLFETFQDGIPVAGCEILVLVEREYKVGKFQSYYCPVPKADLSAYSSEPPKLPAGYAMVEGQSPRRVLLPKFGGEAPVPTYGVRAKKAGAKVPVELVIHAGTGEVLETLSPRAEF